MESPVEGLYTPDFIESECSINIPGVKWNEPTPRSVTPRPISEMVVRRALSQMSKVRTLTGKEGLRPLSATASGNPAMDAETERVYEEVKRLYLQLKGRSSKLRKATPEDLFGTKNESRFRKKDSASVVRTAHSELSVVVDCASSLSLRNRPKSQNSRNGQNLDIPNRFDQADNTPENESETPREQDTDRSTSGDPVSAISKASSRCSTGISHKSIDKKDGHTKCNGHESKNVSNAALRSFPASFIENESSELSGLRSSNSVNKSVVQRTTSNCSVVNSTSFQKEDQSFRKSEHSRNSNKDSLVKCYSANSIFSENVSTPKPESLVLRDLTKSGTPERSDRDKSIKDTTSTGSVIMRFSNKGSVEPSLNEDVYTSPQSSMQTSSADIHSLQSTPRFTENRNFREDKYSPKSADLKVKRDEGKSSHSLQLTPSDVSNSFASRQLESHTLEKSTEKNETPPFPVTSTRASSGRVSRIPVRTCTPKNLEPAYDQSSQKTEKNQLKSLCQDGSSKVKGKISKSRQENSETKVLKKTRQTTVALKAGQKEEGNISTKMTALERRKAYEAKRKSEQMVASSAKKNKKTTQKQHENKLPQPANANSIANSVKQRSEKIPSAKTKTPSTGNKSKQSPPVSTEANEMRKSSEHPLHHNTAYVNKEVNAICTNPKLEDDFNYEDDFDPIAQGNIAQPNAGNEGLQNLGVVNKTETRYSGVQQASAPNIVKEGQSLEKEDNILLLNLQTEKEDHDVHVHGDPTCGRPAVDSGVDEPCTCNWSSNVEFDNRSLDFINLRYNPSHCFKHMHPCIAHVYENLDQIPEYRKMKKEIRKKLRRERSLCANANEQDVRSKPQNAKKKVTMGYVPGYGAVRVMEEHMNRAPPMEEIQNYVASSHDVTGNRPRPGRSQREIAGYVPGYGPVRGAPIKVKPQMPSEKVVLPAINLGGASHGDYSEKKKSRGKRRNDDVLESRARAKPFNTYTDEEASRRFERQYNWRQY